VNQDKPNGHLGIGTFNLIRTPLYKEFGGYEALRLCVVDDIKLGQLVRRAGGRHALSSAATMLNVWEHLGVLCCRVFDFQRNPGGNCLQTTPLAVARRGVCTICLCGPLLRRAKLDDRNVAPARHSMAGYILSAGDSAIRERALADY
jgi:hypothetical protein